MMNYIQPHSPVTNAMDSPIAFKQRSQRRTVDIASERKKANERKLMEELADVEILEDTLNKSMTLTDQMDDMLRSFDQRLQNFEKAILPIHRSTQRLNRFYDNIEKTLIATQKIIDFFDLAEREQKIITNGPNEEDLTPFLESLGRVNEALAFLSEAKFTSGEKAVYKLRQIHNLGTVQLIQLFRNWLTQLSAPLAHLPRLETPPSYPPQSIQPLSDLANWLNSCPVLLEVESKPETTYTQIRASFLTKSLEPLADATMDDVLKKGSTSFILLVNWLHKLLQSEKVVMKDILGPKFSTSRVWEALISNALDLVVETGKKVLSAIKRRNDFSLVFLLFNVLDFWSAQRDVLSIHFLDLPKKSRLLEAMFDSWTVAALKVIPDFLEEVKHLNKGPIPLDATVHESTTNTMVFLKKLLDYPDATESILQTIGEKNWATQNLDITEVQYAKNSDGALTQKYFGMVLNALESNLESKSKQYKKPLFAALFMLNNMNYLNKSIRSNPKSPASLCARFESSIKKYREQFLDLSFRPLLTHLMDVTVIQGGAIKTGLTSTERATIKEKFKNFNSDFDDLVKTLKTVSVSDSEMKTALIKEGNLVIGPMYERFYTKYIHSDFSKNKEKYIRYDVSQVKAILSELFA